MRTHFFVFSVFTSLYSMPLSRSLKKLNKFHVLYVVVVVVQPPSRVQLFATPWTAVFPVLHHLPKFAQVHVHGIGDAIQPSHSQTLSSPSALNLSQHQGLFQ